MRYSFNVCTNYTQLTRPAVLPISLAEMADYLIDVPQDAYLSGLIRQAVAMAENFTGKAFISRQFRGVIDLFPIWWVELTQTPVISVESVKYYDPDSVLQTVDSSKYFLDVGNIQWPARLMPTVSQSWPATWPLPAAVQIDFTAGFGPDWNDVPEDIRGAIMRLVAFLHEHRGDDDPAALPVGLSMPPTVRQMLLQYRTLPRQ